MQMCQKKEGKNTHRPHLHADTHTNTCHFDTFITLFMKKDAWLILYVKEKL